MEENNINWKDFFQAINHPALILDSSHLILAANKASQKYTDLSEDEIVGKQCFEIIHSEDFKEASGCCPLEILIKEGSKKSVEMEIKAFGGYALISCTPIFDEKDNLNKIILIATDITPRKKSENALKASEKNFSQLIDDSPLAIALYGKKGNLKLLNKRFIGLTGYNLNDIPSINDWFLKAYPDPDYRSLIIEKWTGNLKKIKKYKGYLGPLVAEVSCKDGSLKTMEFFTSFIGENIVTVLNDATPRATVENDLKESQQLLQDIINFLPDPTLVIDEKGVVISWNRAIEELTGVKSEEMVGKSNYEYALPFFGKRRPLLIDLVRESDAEIQKKYSFLEREGNIILGETEGSVKGEERVLWGKAAPLCDREGTFKGSIETIRDITERRKVQESIKQSEKNYRNMVEELKIAEEALKKSEKNYRELVDNSLVGIFKTNLEGEILFANDAMAKMFHYSSVDELKENNIINVYKSNKERLGFIEELEKRGRITDYEVQTVGKDGQKVNVLVSASIEDGVLSGMFMDITDRKKSELKLKEREEQIGAIFNTVKSGIILVDKEGIIDFANQHMTEMFNFKLSELIGMSYLDLTSDEVREKAKTKMMTLINGEIDYVLQERPYQRKDGSVFWGQVSANRLLNDDGSLKGLIGVITDISDRKKSEKKLKESLEEKEVLLREIHHRVKNNMQIISSLLNLQIQFEDFDETVGVLKESQGRVKSMAMVHEKLYQSNSFSKINFKEYLTNLVSDIFYSYGIKRETISWELDIEDVNIGIDTAIPLGLIINELVTNSVKYAFPDNKGTIRITFKLEDHSHILIISDDGVGMPEDIEPGKTGTLGLQLVMSLVNQLDGTLKLDRDMGTIYTIKFKELKYKERI